MHSLQKLWPQGVETGRSNKSKQMGQSSCSLDSRVDADAISGNVYRRKKHQVILRKMFCLFYIYMYFPKTAALAETPVSENSYKCTVLNIIKECVITAVTFVVMQTRNKTKGFLVI